MHNKLIKRMWMANFWQLAMFSLLWLATLTVGTYLWLNHAVNSNNKIAWIFLFAPLLAVIMYIVSQVRFSCELNTLTKPDKRRALFPMTVAMKHNYSWCGVGLIIAGYLFLIVPLLIFFIPVGSTIRHIHISWMVVFYFCWLAIGTLNRLLLAKAVTGKAWNKPTPGVATLLGALIAAPIAVYLLLVAGNIKLEKQMNSKLAAEKEQGRTSYLEDTLALPRFSRPSPIEDAVNRFPDTKVRELGDVNPYYITPRLMLASPTSDEWLRVETMLKISRDTFALIDEISSHSEASFEYDFTWEEADLLLLPHLAIFREIVNFNNLRMIIATHNGDSDAAFAYWKQNLNLQKQLTGDLLPISLLVLSSIDESTLRVLNRCIAMGAFSDDQLREIAEDLQRFELAAKAFTGFAIDMERLYAYNVFYNESMHEDISYTSTSTLLDKLLAPIVRRGILTYTVQKLDTVSHMFSDADVIEPYCIEKDIFKKSSEESNFYHGGLPGMELYKQILHGYSDILVRGRATQVLIAAELFRRNNGELPRFQQELVPNYLPALPVDPYTGYPLIYEFIVLDIPLNAEETIPARVLSVRSYKSEHNWEMYRNHTRRGAIRIIDILK